MRKKLSIISLVLFILIQLSPLQVNASTVSNELKVSSELTQWVLDEPTNTLYAISETGKNLIFINATTMSIEKTLTLNGGPTDIIKDNGKLYIALDESKQIVIVDLASKEVTGRLDTSSDPYRIAKDGEKIYYTERKERCRIYEYNLIANTDQMIQVYSAYEADLAINTIDHILYIGDSGSSNSNMTYYSTSDNKVIGKTDYDGGYGFPYPARNVIFDGTNVYYAGRDFKLGDPTIFNGDFGGVGVEGVVYVNKGLVYTRTSIYDKDTHIKLGDYGLNADLVQASDSTLYIYNKDKGTIKRCNDNNKIIDNSNVISLIPGNLADPIPNNQQSTQINSGMSALPMKSKLIQWILDEPTNTLYGISKNDKTLFFINAQTLNLEKSLTFASGPTDIIEDDENLYIALDDTNQIIIVNMASKEITGTLYTSSDPYRIVKDGDKIYYTERDQWCNIYEYNLTTSTDQKISLSTVHQPDLAINTMDHILYIGESGISAYHTIYFSTTDNKVIGEMNNYQTSGLHFPGRYTLFDGEKVYYAGFAFDKQNPKQMLGQYAKEDIIFVKYGSAFTKTNIYDSESYSLIGNNNFDLIEISDQFVMFFYSQTDNSILRIDQSKISNVQFNSQGGSDVDDIVVDNNGLIPAPVPPTRAGFKFDGWYKEAGCINPWILTTDKVTSDITLYAKWTSIVPVVNNGWSYFQGKWYFFNNRVMAINVWRQDSSKRWYYLGADGAMISNSWKQDSSKHWYYLGSDGSMAVNSWISYNKKWYYLKANGEMATGWVLYKGDWYYLYPNGEMASNTIIDRYKLKENGAMLKMPK